MSDYNSKLDEWRDAARRKARELDERYNIKNRVEDSARRAEEAARLATEAARRAGERASETVADAGEHVRAEAERLGAEAERLTQDSELREAARRAAEEAARQAREVSETFRAGARAAGRRAEARAGQVFDDARGAYERAASVANFGAQSARAGAALTGGAWRLQSWARQHPGQAVLVSFSLVAGVRIGSAFPGFDGVLLGAHPHWFTHSALPVYALRKAGDKFDSYLREREQLVSAGELTEAERKRVEWERQAVKLVGAPLLGAFSCAAGVAMWGQILQPGRITGAPISWLLGGNPLLDSVWLFANGVICFQQGYKFFMIALRDEQTAQRVVRELRGLLPDAV